MCQNKNVVTVCFDVDYGVGLIRKIRSNEDHQVIGDLDRPPYQLEECERESLFNIRCHHSLEFEIRKFMNAKHIETKTI